MNAFNFNIRKILSVSIKTIMIIILIYMFFLFVFKVCFRINHQTHLELKDGSDISLYQRDSAWLKIWGGMKEWNNYIIDNNNWLNDSNFVRLDIRLRNIDTIALNNFSVKLCYIKDDISKEIIDGRIYYDPESYDFDDFHLYQNMTDTFRDYTFINPSWNFGTLLVVKSRPSVEIEKADKFVTDIFLDCKIDGKPVIIHKVDTLYKKKKRMFGISGH